MAKLADKVSIETRGAGKPGSILIDGEEFPWHVAAQDIEIIQDHATGLTTVYLPIFTRSVVAKDG